MYKQQKKILIMLLLMVPLGVFAQDTSDTDELKVIELELENQAPKEEPVAPTPSQNMRETIPKEEPSEAPLPKENVLRTFSDLGNLAPFREISVIQKRFMPKTGRFQLFGGGTILTNNPFFNTIGGVAKASYFLTESWGLELNYFALTTSEKQTTQELRDIQNVKTQNLVYPQSFAGVDLMYVPFYGKMAWFSEKIIPFDLYFSAGYGTTNTQAGENAGTVHLGTGQIFSLGKSYAFRWDFSWNFFDAKAIDGSTSSFNNLFLTVGMSWFFPEASYR